MDHEAVRDMVSAYYDGELPRSDRPAVEAHLGMCADCRLFYDHWTTLSGRLFDKKLPQPSEFFVRGVMARIDALDAKKPREKQVFRIIPVEWFAPVFGLAAMLLLALVPASADLPSTEGLLLGGRSDTVSQWLATGAVPKSDMMNLVMEES